MGLKSPEVFEKSLRNICLQLIDMGFARQHAVEALIHSNNNMTAATEYVLSRPSLSIPMVSMLSKLELQTTELSSHRLTF